MVEDKCMDYWIERLTSESKMQNKLRYMLETFFYSDGWKSKTNDKAMRKGHDQEYTYSKESIAHFIEDAMRYYKKEWVAELNKLKELRESVTSRMDKK